MFRFDDFVGAAVSAARRHGYAVLLSRSLFVSGCVSLVLALGVRFAPLSSSATKIALLVLLAIALAVPLVLTLIAARRAYRVPQILFDLDRKLDLEARISSLHVLSASNPSSVFYDRLAHAVEEGSEGWRRVYRLSLRTWSQFTVGLVCVLSIAVLAVIGEADRIAAPSLSSDVAAPAGADPVDSVASDVEDLLDEQQTADEAPGDWIALALEDLLAARDPEQPSESEIPEDFDAAEVESYTAALLESLRQDGARPLSDDELDRLSALSEAAPMDLRGALEAVLLEDDPEEVQDQLDLISKYARQQARLNEMLAAEEGSALEETGGHLPRPGPGAGDEEGTYPMSGFGDEGDTAPSLAEAPLPGELGEAGEVYEYITGGVPIEFPTDGEVLDESGRPTVDYARVQTILDTRALPQDAFATVRRYFELISSGGDS